MLPVATQRRLRLAVIYVTKCNCHAPCGQGNCCNSCYCGGNQQQQMVQSRCGEQWTRATRWQIVEAGSYFILFKKLLEFLKQFGLQSKKARYSLKWTGPCPFYYLATFSSISLVYPMCGVSFESLFSCSFSFFQLNSQRFMWNAQHFLLSIVVCWHLLAFVSGCLWSWPVRVFLSAPLWLPSNNVSSPGGGNLCGLLDSCPS